MSINITFPDGNVRQYDSGITALDIAKSVSNSLPKKNIICQSEWRCMGCHTTYIIGC